MTVNPEAIIDLTQIETEIALFPNPNNGTMTLTYAMSTADKGTFTLYNVLGQLITEYKLDAFNSELKISNEQLSNGTYLYSVIINDVEVKRDKVIIVK